MPVDRRAFLQLSVLILALPCQYLVSKYWTYSAKQRNNAIKNILSSSSGFTDKYLSWHAWKQWCTDLISSISKRPDDSTRTSSNDADVRRAALASAEAARSEDEGESPAVDVLKHRNPDGYFAGSSVPRSPRSSKIEYRIGQVVRNKVWGYRGVIIGWDDTARAPDYWLHHNHVNKPQWRHQPNYSILVHTRDRAQAQVTYVPQENIQPMRNERINHPDIDDYFDYYDGTTYIPRKWLRGLYPHD